MATERLVLLGVDHTDYGKLALQTVGRTAAAISVGGDHVRIRKGDLLVPNEDCCLCATQNDRTLLVVCDGHSGHWASHGLAEALAEIDVPGDLLSLLRAVRRLAQPIPPGTEGLPNDLLDARTTCLVAVLDRKRNTLFGFSYGDSSIFVVSERALPVRSNDKNDHYVSPWDPDSMAPQSASEFQLPVAAGDLIVVCTDGVDECHYHRPETSVGPEQLWNLRLEVGGDPAAYARALGELALRGVAGSPGGQDNLALVVAAV